MIRGVERRGNILDRWDARGRSESAITQRWRELLRLPLGEVGMALLADTEAGRETLGLHEG